MALGMVATLLSGCGWYEAIREKKEEKAREQVALQKLNEQSDQNWKESTERKNGRHDPVRGGGQVTFDGHVVALNDLTLYLGPLKTPGDLAGGQAPSELVGSSTNGVSLSIKGIPIEAAVRADQVSGQTCEIKSGTVIAAEIVAEDGARWRIQDGLVNFLRVEQGALFVMIEGRVAPEGDTNAAAVKLSADLQARVANLEIKPDGK